MGPVSMPADQRAQLRAVFKRVHPDLFAASPDARSVNAEALKVCLRTFSNQPYVGGASHGSVLSLQWSLKIMQCS